MDDPLILWDAIRGFIKNNATAFASGLNKSQLKKISELEKLLMTFRPVSDYSPNSRQN